VLEKIDQSLVETYAAKTGVDPTVIRDWMAAETWFTAQESVDNKFADRVAEDAPAAKAAWDLSAYARKPEPLEESAEAIASDEQLEAEHAERIRNADFLLNVA
jgi:ATP-dependent Clp protease protease subunit